MMWGSALTITICLVSASVSWAGGSRYGNETPAEAQWLAIPAGTSLWLSGDVVMPVGVWSVGSPGGGQNRTQVQRRGNVGTELHLSANTEYEVVQALGTRPGYYRAHEMQLEVRPRSGQGVSLFIGPCFERETVTRHYPGGTYWGHNGGPRYEYYVPSSSSTERYNRECTLSEFLARGFHVGPLPQQHQ